MMSLEALPSKFSSISSEDMASLKTRSSSGVRDLVIVLTL
jgi:hypothetical protein